MDLQLTFATGSMRGDGSDDVGPFLIRGRYDSANRECSWTKTYIGGHDVYYRGFREGKGIWGTWEISIRWHGGFHIWPRVAGETESDELKESAPETEAADAVGREETSLTTGH